MALSEENEKLREELNKNLIEGAGDEPGDNKDEVQELMIINQSLNEANKALQIKLSNVQKEKQNQIAKLNKELGDKDKGLDDALRQTALAGKEGEDKKRIEKEMAGKEANLVEI